MEKFAVITGASSGIGRATAIEFAKHRYAIAILARRGDRLDRLKAEIEKVSPEACVVPLVCDVTRWEAVKKAAETVGQHWPHVNVLVNNAGAFEYLSLEKSSPEKLDEMIDVNVRGVVYVTKAFLPLLKKGAEVRPPAKIVNVSSIGGLWGFPNMSVYTATKFAVTGFSSALRRELRRDGIDVASIHPGPVDNAEVPKAGSARGRLVMLPPQIARQIFRLAASRKRRHISHPAFSLLNLLENISPEMVDRVLKKIL